MQPKFSYGVALAGLVLFSALVAADQLIEALPDRQPAPPALASVQLEPISVHSEELAPLEVVGAWRLDSQEPRVGGISGLVIDRDELIAVTDRGAILRLPKRHRPRMRIHVSDLPDGPGDPTLRSNRDSEALLPDPAGRGWWVAFENRHELWLYDEAFRRALRRVRISSRKLTENTGVEALAAGAGQILAFPERGSSVLQWSGGRWSENRMSGRRTLSDAVQLDGGLILLERDLAARGFKNALALVERDEDGFRTVWRRRLPVAWRDNLEALAAERIAGGGYRLWVMSDDNFHPRMRTVLLVIDVPAAALPKRP